MPDVVILSFMKASSIVDHARYIERRNPEITPEQAFERAADCGAAPAVVDSARRIYNALRRREAQQGKAA